MVVLKSSRKRSKLISYNRESSFRTTLISIARVPHMLFLSTFNNIYIQYEIVSVPVANGTYKIRVTSLDNLNNESGNSEGTVVVSSYIIPPSNVSVSIDDHDITLTWEESIAGAPDYYVVYGNGGSGETIDRSTPLATVLGSLLTTTFTVADGDWKFVVEAQIGSEESENLNAVYQTVPEEDSVPRKPGISGNSPNSVTGLLLTNVSVGKVNIQFHWLFGSEAASFNIYHDNGTGTIDYNTPAFSFSRQDSEIQSYTTTQLHSEDEDITYKFVVRAVSSNSVEEDNEDEYEISVDGAAPDEPIDLDLSTAF